MLTYSTYKRLSLRFCYVHTLIKTFPLSDALNELNDLQTYSSMKYMHMCTQAFASNHLVITSMIPHHLISFELSTCQICSAIHVRWMNCNEMTLHCNYQANNFSECGKSISEQQTDPY